MRRFVLHSGCEAATFGLARRVSEADGFGQFGRINAINQTASGCPLFDLDSLTLSPLTGRRAMIRDASNSKQRSKRNHLVANREAKITLCRSSAAFGPCQRPRKASRTFWMWTPLRRHHSLRVVTVEVLRDIEEAQKGDSEPIVRSGKVGTRTIEDFAARLMPHFMVKEKLFSGLEFNSWRIADELLGQADKEHPEPSI